MSLVHHLLLLLLAAVSLLFSPAAAQPAQPVFSTSCFTGNASQQLSISSVYAQIVDRPDGSGRFIDFTLLGTSSQEIIATANDTGRAATLFTTSYVLTMGIYSNRTFLCDFVTPPSSVSNVSDAGGNTGYCPIPAGDFGLSTSVPWNSDHELTTIMTQIQAEDPYSNQILCVSIYTTPLDPNSQSSYGKAIIIFWATVGLAIGYWLIVGIARIVSAFGRGVHRGPGLWSKVKVGGYILASAISGERLATSPALMRFCTPSMRDIIFHTQWCTAVAMVAVEWPTVIYPLMSQTAWAMLSYNITVTANHPPHYNPLAIAPYNPPSNFASQMSDPSSVIYMNTSLPNTFFMLPSNASEGIERFAYTIGVRPQDLFGICMALFLAIVAACICISLFIWAIDCFGDIIGSLRSHAVSSGRETPPATAAMMSPTPRSPRWSLAGKDYLDSAGNTSQSPDESRSNSGHLGFGRLTTTKVHKTSRKHWWWKLRSDGSSFHWDVLHGNLVRILVWFHLPVTLFSSYQFTLFKSGAAGAGSLTLAVLSFAVVSIIIPVILVYRLKTTSTNKLYDETRTLLFLGPLYNHYRHGSQLFASLLFATNIAFGLVIGCGQSSGTAQAIVILVIEIASALVTSIWLPWGSGASMGLISFLFCVARIVVAVLLVILTPAISIGSSADSWVAYGIMIVLALVYLAFALILVLKFIEAFLRIVAGVGFDRSRHVSDSGLLGVLFLIGCCSSRRPRSSSSRARKQRQVSHHPGSSAGGSGTTRPRSESSIGLYKPPNGQFGHTHHHNGSHLPGSAAGSTHSGQPASVLRPEHALRPYHEDSDDESGHIMSSWQLFTGGGGGAGRQGAYSPVDATPPKAETTPSSGFSRVGGGRAHIDSPYAITHGPSVGITGPSASSMASQDASTGGAGAASIIGTRTRADSSTTRSRYDSLATRNFAHATSGSGSGSGGYDDFQSTASRTTVAQYPMSTLPAGAMPPAHHVRTKSQTAIVEHAVPIFRATGPPARLASTSAEEAAVVQQQKRRFSVFDDDDDEDDDDDGDDNADGVGRDSHPRKKHWFQLRKTRRPSDGDAIAQQPQDLGPPPPATEEEGGGGDGTAGTGRSFVVLRERRPGTSQPSAGPSSYRPPRSPAGQS